MEAIFLDLVSNYGIGGMLIVALIWIVKHFTTHVSNKDGQIQEMHKEMVAVVTKNAEASTELITIIKMTNKQD